MKININVRDKAKVILSNYGSILYNDFCTKGMSQEEMNKYFENKAVKSGDIIEGSLAYLITSLQLGSEAHGFSAIENGVNGEFEVFEEGDYIW